MTRKLSEEESIYYEFLLTMSKLFEKFDDGHTWYDGLHLTTDSIYCGLYYKFLRKTGRIPDIGKS